jgi:hypothetical protein
MFHCHPLLKHMQKLTGKSFEKMAVMELIIYLENQVDQIALQSIKELNQLNKLRKIQGLYQKNRIDRLCISSAIKHLNNEVPPQQRNTRRKKW